jgi:filamentous hemagglutinin family protein
MNITQTTDRAAIDWTSFDIASNEHVNFNQRGADSIALNRVTGNDVSQIYGSLTANGKVFLINPNGVLFGKGASVDVGGLVASTAKVDDTFMKGFGTSTGDFALNIEENNTAAIINQAFINEKLKNEGGLVVLHAANVDNEGKITTGKGGKVQLAAGQKLNVNFDSAKINFTVDGGLSEANVLNAGTISAQNGVIAMTARGADKVLSSVVNTEGAKLEAKGLAVNEKGEIVLDAGTGITAISGTVDASGENDANGGNITVNSDFIYVDNKAELNASGANGGNVFMKTVKVAVEPNANIHAEATAGKGHSTGQWKVDVNGSVNSWWGNEGQMDAAKEKLAEAKKKVDEQFETAQAKYAEAEAAKQARDAAQAKVDSLTKDIEAKTADNNDKKAAMAAAEKELKAAKDLFDKADKALKEAQKTLESAKSTDGKAKEALSAAQTERDNAQKALNEASAKLKLAEDNASTAQGELKKADEALKAAQQDFSDKSDAYDKCVTARDDAKKLAKAAAEVYEKVNGYVSDMDKYRKKGLGLVWNLVPYNNAYNDLHDFMTKEVDKAKEEGREDWGFWKVLGYDILDFFGLNVDERRDIAYDVRDNVSAENTSKAEAYNSAQGAVDSALTEKDLAEGKIPGLKDAYDAAEADAKSKQDAVTPAKEEADKAQGEFDSKQGAYNTAKTLADSAAGTFENASVAVEAAENVKNGAQGVLDTKQGVYDTAKGAAEASDKELTGLKASKAEQEVIVSAKGEAYKTADEANKTSLKDAMGKLVNANKAYAKSAYDNVNKEAYGKISSQAISKTLENTSVTIVADNDTNTADIGMYGSIIQNEGADVKLTLRADRNVILRSPISSEKKLTIVTEAGSPIALEQGNREGEKFGATLIYSDINTNGILDITGNTYIGHYIRGNNAGEETGYDIHREAGKIAAKNVRFGGDVVLATGGTVDITADEKYGTVKFEGTINSGNAYAFREISKEEQAQLKAEAAEQGEGVHPNYWEYARKKAAEGNGHVAGESYLATITDGIEDSAASAVRPGNYNESYVGGKAGEWVKNEDGTETRDWEWVEGPEAGETFFTQTRNKNKNVVSGSVTDGYYSNFLAGEPSDTNALQDVLAIEYKGHWDDAFATGNKNGKSFADSYIQEINVGESSLNINSPNIELNGEIGNKRALNSIGLEGNTASIASPITTKGDMTINAALTGKNISLTSTEGSITLNNTVTAGTPKVEEAAVPQRRLMRLRSAVPTEGDVELNAAKDINSSDVTAQNKISFNAGNNVNLNGALKAGSNENGAVQISAGDAFINNVGANVIDTNGTWQVYSETPENDFFNGLYSENTAVWKADGTVDNNGKNTYSFKYQPTLTVTANDVTKTYGDVSTGDGYKVTSNLADKNNKDEDLSKVFMDTTLAPKSFVEGVNLTSDGFASLASVADYDIKVTASGKNGYGLAFNGGKLTVNPKDVNLNYGGYEIVDSRIKVLDGTPSYDSQIVDGDTTAPKVSYGTTGLGDGLSYGVDYYVNGEKISSGDTVGNYRFNYDDSTVIRLDNPENYKPQTNELMTSAVALKGNADVELSQKTAKVDGVDKVAGLMDGRLPLFKFAGSQVIPCGMFDISSTPDSVTMTASKISETDMSAAMEMPELEVNQYREYDRMLDTVDGAAAFKLTYNGASFDIYPNDNQATALLEKGEETNNVNVGAAALSAAFGEMGLSLEEMQVICVHMDAKEILA